MTKKELEQIYYLSREIKMWEQEIEVLTARYLAAPQETANINGGISNKVAAVTEKKIILENKIRTRQDEMQKARDNAIEYILTIPDSLTRMVIYYRCIKLMSWKRVACEVGGYNTPDGVRKIYTRFFDKK